MYEFGTLRPPTQKEMEQRYVPLERVRVTWRKPCPPEAAHVRDEYCNGGGEVHCYGISTLPVAELAEFMKDNVIPMGAHIVPCGDDGELSLSWTHLKLCEVCELWTEPHGVDDMFHVFKLSMMEPEGNPLAQVTA